MWPDCQLVVLPNITTHTHRVEPGDIILGMTDGIGDNILSKELVDIFDPSISIETAAYELERLVLERQQHGDLFNEAHQVQAKADHIGLVAIKLT